jgi:hypothetical protein
VLGAVTIIALADRAQAAVTPEEAKQLGTTLTEFGAEKAGNADGSIPSYTHDPVRAPPGFKPGSGRYPDPFSGEKPLFSIDAKNVAQYAGMLTEGVKEQIRRFPTFRMDVYPTHRTIRYPKHVLDRCAKNAVTAKLTETGNGVDGEPYGCVPFPIPKNGLEVLWNHILRYQVGETGMLAHQSTWIVDANGRRTDSGGLNLYYYNWYTESGRTQLRDKWASAAMVETTRPSESAGEKTLIKYSIDYDKQDSRAWFYTPGQRRVRIAPEFAYDTPNASIGGLQFFDEIGMFAGKPDRFDFKLIGKKEMYIPYNDYRFTFDVPPETSVTPKHVNPNVVRWEKHRVWVVEATLKPGKRHVYQRRTFIFDEDSWSISGVDAYDHAGKLAKTAWGSMVPLYDSPSFAYPEAIYDLNKGAYGTILLYHSKDDFCKSKGGVDPGMLSAERVGASSTR